MGVKRGCGSGEGETERPREGWGGKTKIEAVELPWPESTSSLAWASYGPVVDKNVIVVCPVHPIIGLMAPLTAVESRA